MDTVQNKYICIIFVGASHYGVADIGLLAEETHKFESQYMNSMVGPYVTDEDKQIYKDRSPINSIDTFKCPIAFFQGDEDKVFHQSTKCNTEDIFILYECHSWFDKLLTNCVIIDSY